MAASITPPLSFETRYKQGELSEFFALAPSDTQAALNLNRNSDHSALLDVLSAYAKKLNAPKQVFEQLELLKVPESRAVVTGQQTGLLLGPNYSLSKAVTAINLAKRLSTDEKPVLPIFWIASQDHDTEEIDNAYLLDFNEELHYLTIDLPKDTPAARIALQEAWLERLKIDIGAAKFHEVFTQDVNKLLEDAFAVSESYADWFAAILYRLLGQHGLIIVDPMQPDIAELFKPIFKQELEDPRVSVNAINDAARRLKAIGVEPQLGRGENATNLFLEEQTDQGFKRELLRFDGKTFFTEINHYSKEELFAKLEDDPRCITPAAGFRPVTQDYLLPTAITVGGPGELKYIAQLKGVFEHHNVDMPIIWSRATATLLEPPVLRIMNKFNLKLEDSSGFESLKNEKLLELHGHADAFEGTLETLNESIQNLLTEIIQIDPTLEASVKKGERHLNQTLAILKTKSGKALANRDDTYTKQFDRLEKHLLPNGTPQERKISPFSFFLKFGIDPVINAMLDLPPEGNHSLSI